MCREELGEILKARGEQDRQVAAIDDVRPQGTGLTDKPAEVRVHLGNAPGDVEHGNPSLGNGLEAGLHRPSLHPLPAIGARIHVAMAAGLVAHPADVDLEDRDAIGPEGPEAAGAECLVERRRPARGREQGTLLGRVGQRVLPA